MRANFKNITTGELFHVTTHRLLITDNGTINVDPDGKTIVDPKTGEELKSIPFDDQTDDDYTSIVTAGAAPKEMSHSSREGALKHFRSRADRHTRSDEGKHQRLKSINREINSINKSKGGQQRQE